MVSPLKEDFTEVAAKVDPISAVFGDVSSPEEEDAWKALESSQTKTAEPAEAVQATALTFDNVRHDIHRNKSTPTFRP